MKTLILLSAMMALSFNAYSAPKNKACENEDTYKLIKYKELDALVKEKKAFVIDVNGTESYAKTHVPTAVDYAAIEKTLPTALPKDKNALIVAYCGGPQCNAWKQAAQAACDLGYTNIQHFKGGITGWTKKHD